MSIQVCNECGTMFVGTIHCVRHARPLRRVARWKAVAQEYKRRFRISVLVAAVLRERHDALGKRIEELEEALALTGDIDVLEQRARLTAPPGSVLRVRAKSTWEGRMR